MLMQVASRAAGMNLHSKSAPHGARGPGLRPRASRVRWSPGPRVKETPRPGTRRPAEPWAREPAEHWACSHRPARHAGVAGRRVTHTPYGEARDDDENAAEKAEESAGHANGAERSRGTRLRQWRAERADDLIR